MRRFPAFFFLSLALALLAAACGGKVVVDAQGASAGAGGATSSGATSGTSTTSSSTSSTGSTSSTTVGAGGAGPLPCGGELGPACPAGLFCDFPDDQCGGDDSQGTCLPLPSACPPDCPGVCGCDGLSHCSVCSAHAAGTDVNANGACASPNAQYRASLFPLDVDHLVLQMGDPVRNICLQIFFDSPAANNPAFSFTTPPTWGINTAVITPDFTDCLVDGPDALPGAEVPTSGSGSVSWTVPPEMTYPCALSFQAKLDFPGAPAWVHPLEVADAKGVKVEGGCF